MSMLSAFVAELVKDANQIDKLGESEKRRMLERAVTIIRDIREEIGIPLDQKERDIVIDYQTIAASIARRDNLVVAGTFLDAAENIRVLKILLDKTEPSGKSKK